MKKVLQKLLLILLCFVGVQAFAQERTVTGQTTDKDGLPLPGVSVYVKASNIGTVTNLDGAFSLSVPDNENSILVFSSLGFQPQEIRLGNQTTFQISLTDDTQGLDEVVVVGYGTQKRANLTGAVSTVDTEVLEARPITDVARGLQGTTPGLTITAPSGQIGENPIIKLRGSVGTLGTGGGAEPLILVDNVEIANLQMINPQDIESISVLKDAASTSIYGARAAWGVILITTKKGKRGTDPVVSYSNNFSWATPTTTPKVAPAAEGAEMGFAAVRRRIPSLESFGVVGMYVDQTAIDRMREWEELYGGQDLGPEMVLDRDFEIRDGRLFFYRSWDPRKLFVKEWTPQQKQDISVSGGSEKTNYYIGLGRLDQQGVLKVNPDEFVRNNLNLSVNTSVTDWFDARASVLYSTSNSTKPFYFSSQTYDPWYYVSRWPAQYPYGTYQGKPFRNHISEVEQAKMNELKNSSARINIGATIRPTKGLAINFDYTHDRINEQEHQTGGVLSAYNFWSTGADLEFGPYSSPAYNRVQYNSSLSEKNTFKAFATYEKNFGDHDFKLITGGDMEEFEFWFHSSQKRNLLDPDMGEIDLATGDMFVNGARDNWTTLGVFGRVNYSFKNKFLLEVNGRYDGSSRLSSDEKWGFFPSMSAGYIISEESFMDFSDSYLSFLKFRGSYGSIGNQNANLGNIYRIMNPTSSNWLINNQNMLTVTTPGALPSGLTWETVTTLDLGVDARFFRNKLGMSFDWYERAVTDMHSAGVTLPSTFGTSSPLRNFGELKTTGWELELNFRHTFTNGLNINAVGTLSDFKEKITKYANTTMGIDSFYEGKVLGEIWGFETDRLFNENDVDAEGNLVAGIPSQELFETNGWFFYGPGDVKYKDLNGDGVINYGSRTVDDHGDMKVIGNSTPRYQYGIRLGADFKGFDLSMFMQGVGKRDLWANGPVVIPGYRYGEGWFEHQLDYWTPENQDAFYPRPNDQAQSNNAMNFLPQSKYLLDMSYFRMKNITFGYTIPSEMTSKIYIDKFRVYFSGENLFEFDNLTVPIDPEVDYTVAGLNDSNTFGRVYPFTRSLSFGVQLSL
jgi:TonB-linked SusC/RagA family outer membrane protein